MLKVFVDLEYVEIKTGYYNVITYVGRHLLWLHSCSPGIETPDYEGEQAQQTGSHQLTTPEEELFNYCKLLVLV